MTSGVIRGSRFLLERWVQRGVVYQLLLMAVLVVLVAVLGGCAAWLLTPAFQDLPSAVWWSFLRLTDPGYLGDDEGVVLRVVSTVVTVLGYVLFMGSLIAIMTQWLAATIRKLESGLTPISMADHLVILGWTNRTPEIVKKLLTAGGRLERFFAQRGGSSRLRVVVLADEIDGQRRSQLREYLGDVWSEKQVFLRSGSSLRYEDLKRLDLQRAAAVMIPGADFELGGAEMTDTRVIKTLLTLDALFRRGSPMATPQVVAELVDPYKVPIAQRAIAAPIEVIASDRLISRLLSQSLRHPGVATVLLKLLTHREGNGLYLRGFPELAGKYPRALISAFPRAVVLGVVSTENGVAVQLDPTHDAPLLSDDQLVLVAERYDQCVPSGEHPGSELPPRPSPLRLNRTTDRRRLLILGWSFKIATLLSELVESSDGAFDITIMSRVGEGTRANIIDHVDLQGRITVVNVEGDYSLERELALIEPHTFDHVLFMASSWMQSSNDADARTLLGILQLRSMLKRQGGQVPEILVEFLDSENARILGEATEPSDSMEIAFVSPQMLSHLLSHVALRPQLNAVFEQLIGAEGAELDLLDPEELDLDRSREVTFLEVQEAAASFGCVALGFLSLNGSSPPSVDLNPERDQRWSLKKSLRVIVLKSQGAE